MSQLLRPAMALLCAAVMAQSAHADSYDDGLAKLRAGQFKEAGAHFRKAAREGNDDAFYLLGVMHQTGQGVPKSPRDAAILYRHVARKGHRRAQVKLGDLYAAGRGFKQDRVRAYMWYEIAALNGEKISVVVRAKLAVQMKREDVELARRKAKVCLKSKYKKCD